MTLAIMVILTLGSGALAPASAGVLEGVTERRIANDWGLTEVPKHSELLLGVENCDLLGYRGVAMIEGIGTKTVYVVDCQQKTHEPLSRRGLVADVNLSELGHKKAQIWLWR